MTRHDILLECDRIEELGDRRSSDLIALIRLQHWAQTGCPLNDHDQTSVRQLSAKLAIKPTKIISGDIILTQPLGAYYTKITVPHKAMGRKETEDTWASNPIELAEVHGITSIQGLRNSRLHGCNTVSLHFEKCSLSLNFHVLLSLKLEKCQILEIRNLGITPNQIPALKMRIQWPALKTIIVKG